jgi:hypothetical protein
MMSRYFMAVVSILLPCLFGACRAASPAASGPFEVENRGAAADGRVAALGVRATFATVPTADEDGTITGPTPLVVQFDLCQSRTTENDEDLTFSFDFDFDGRADTIGPCRTEHVYEGAPLACVPTMICVDNGRPDGEVCRSYQICFDQTGLPPEPLRKRR